MELFSQISCFYKYTFIAISNISDIFKQYTYQFVFQGIICLSKKHTKDSPYVIFLLK